MVIVCNPGHVLTLSSKSEEYKKERRKQLKHEGKGVNPFVLVLDSLSTSHSNALNKIRSYLQVTLLSKQVKPSSFTGEQPPGCCQKPSQVI